MGTVLGAYIAKAGREIDLVNRNEKHVAALREKGAHIIGKADFVQKVNALLPSEMTEKYDVILLMTKQRDNPHIVAFLKDHLKEDGALCTCQNGLPEPAVAEIIGEDRTLGCAIAWGATFHGEGVSELTSDPSALTFSLGAIGRGNHLQDVKELLECMGTVTVEENFIGARWSKLLINSAFSGLSTVTGGTFGEVAKDKRSRRVVQRIIKECIDVAKAAGIRIGAHPGFPDLMGFGRRKMVLSHDEVKNYVRYQIGALAAFTQSYGMKLQHVAPHGAMGNSCQYDEDISTAICEAICEYDKDLIVYYCAGAVLGEIAESKGLRTASEIFADRAYMDDLSLVPRKMEGSMITDEEIAIQRCVKMIKEGKVTSINGKELDIKGDTLCVHGDGPKALAFVQKIREKFAEEGIEIRHL